MTMQSSDETIKPLLATNGSQDVLISNETMDLEQIELLEPSNSNGFPKAVYFIIGNEFCERFSFYGMKTILFKYFTGFLQFKESNATAAVHGFVMLAYFFPLIGGILSDTRWGRFRTIIYLSLIYCLGNIIMAVTAIPKVTGSPPHWWGAAAGLVLLAVGTGGIKPCVSAFGGDQFEPTQTGQIQLFFSAFYFAVNLGSLLSTFITPEIRATQCFGYTECYSLAFALPALLMIVATIIFISGSSIYKKIPPSGNVMLKVSQVIMRGMSTPTRRGDHWLDSTVAEYGDQMVQDSKKLLSIIFIFIPLPLFWSLFDQQSSRWVSQASLMDLSVDIFGSRWAFKPDQMQIINAVLILVMIPLFERFIYPFIDRFYRFYALRRMVAGMVLTGISFIIAAFLQKEIDKSQIETSGNARCVADCVFVGWQVPQYIVLTAGEILFSISGLEFAYSEAPTSMKSVCQAFWLLTVSFGNLLVAVIAGSNMFTDSAAEYIFFSVLIFLAAAVFSIMARFYKRASAVETSSDS